MDLRRYTRWMLPLAALSLTLTIPVRAHAQSRDDQRRNATQATIQVQFRSTPRWQAVNGTRVEEIVGPERPAYDLFRYNGNYYAYNNTRWYTSTRADGQFNAVDERSVPTEFTRVPVDHWRSYPTAWQERRDPGSSGASATLRVQFGTAPHWTSIGNSRIEQVPVNERPDYDVFRYNGTYYAYDHERWYSSRRPDGDFDMIDDGAVPREFAGIPRDHWRNYPTDWQNGPDAGFDDAPLTLQVNYVRTPYWMNMRGTRVWVVRSTARLDYDLFRVGGLYYAYDNEQWYGSRHRSGVFAQVDERNVPSDLSRIPQDQWRNYPNSWLDQYGNPRRHDYRGDRFDRGDQRSSDQGNRP